MITRSARPPKTPSQQLWPSRSHVTIFVRSLHLLDLDRLEDWPGVSENIFAAKTAQQTLQQRVKAVEWSLYRLFELYDPDETQDKLRPFFPPAAPLQSLNLRAALYRCLTELKKNGVLGKDVLLRKTMLDDCKGERFEEVIANFAMIVLKKSSQQSTVENQRACTDSQLLPVTLAYRKSLQANLKTRVDVQTHTRQELQRLSNAKVNLLNRLEEVSSSTIKPDLERQKEVRALVNGNWIGSNGWTEILLHGAPIENELGDAEDAYACSEASNSRSLLKDLDDRISKHQSRLSEWKLIAEDLKAKQDSERSIAGPKPAQTENDGPFKFSQHAKLTLEEYKDFHAQESPMVKSYSTLLDAMKRELSATSKRTASFGNKQSVSTPTTKVTFQQPEPTIAGDELAGYAHRAPVLKVANEDVALIPEVESKLAIKDGTGVHSSPVSVLEDSFSLPEQPSSTTTAVDTQSSTKKQPDRTSLDTVEEQATSPSKLWMSLAERTRASIALTGRQSILHDPDSPISQSSDPPNMRNIDIPDLQLSSDEDRRSTLLERTRKSMLLFSSKPTASAPRSHKRKSEHKRMSQTYPINQFETPRRPQSHNLDISSDNGGAGSGSSTPREKLFDEDAEYASVFKSRPKIALSPAFSPRRSSGMGLDSVLEDSMQDLDLESD